jgi:hypothetical protein
MPKLSSALLVVLGCLLLAAGPSAAAGSADVIADCNSHARLTRSYTDAQLRNALRTLPADVKEYTDCSDVIQHALLSQVSGSHTGGPGGSGGSGGSFLPSWLVVVLVLLALSGLTLGAVAVRRRNAAPEDRR